MAKWGIGTLIQPSYYTDVNSHHGCFIQWESAPSNHRTESWVSPILGVGNFGKVNLCPAAHCTIIPWTTSPQPGHNEQNNKQYISMQNVTCGCVLPFFQTYLLI